MRGFAILVLATTPLLSGCVAALLPLAAAGALGKGEIDRAKAKRELIAAGAVDLKQPIVTVGNGSKASEQLRKSERQPSEFSGKGEGAEISDRDLEGGSKDYLSRFFQPIGRQASPYSGFAAHALEQSARLEAGEGVESVVLIPRVDIFKPETVKCGGKPLAVLMDLDDQDNGDLVAAETLYRQNGLVEVLRSLRAAEISVIWISDEPVSTAATISTILTEGGLSESESDDFLFLDRGSDDRKQVRRWDAARNYCIVAIAGDERADFDELYDYLRDPDGAISLEHMFGNGWFLTPPPLVVATEENQPASSDEEGS
ncbi:MAG: hypothetical protein ABJN65_13915 [Parasphingorhabdus sp.]